MAESVFRSERPRRKLFRWVVLLLILATLLFIWSRSTKSREESAAESAIVRQLLTPFLEPFVGKGNVTDHLIRKLAHFAEYCFLGVELAVWITLGEKRRLRWLYSVLFGFSVASIDETIQFFVGRGNQFSDVMLDLFGFVCGVGGLCLLLWIAKRGKRKNGRQL